jgi:twinkle protein
VKLIQDNIDLSAYLEPPSPGEKIIPASSLYEQVRDDFLCPQEARGARLPWSKADGLVRFRPGEVSLWPGFNYSGKSLITSQIALSLCKQDERVCMASFEMKPRKTMGRMTRQAAGNPDPSLQFIKRFHEWTDNRLWIFDHMGQIAPQRVVAAVRYCADKLGMTQVFLDSLMKCVRGEDDFNAQKDFANDLFSVAQETNVHIHLVHHTRKPPDENHRPTRFDAKGSGAITDIVDNVFNVWRNKAKERVMEHGTPAEQEKVRDAPDTIIICDKQRHGEWDGNINLWFDRRSQSYMGQPTGWITGMDFVEVAAA